LSHEATDGKQSRVGRSLSSRCPHKKGEHKRQRRRDLLNGHVDSEEEKEHVRISTAANMNGGGDASIFVLYRVVNSDDDNSSSTAFNAFCIPRSALGGGKGPSLSIIKQYVVHFWSFGAKEDSLQTHHASFCFLVPFAFMNKYLNDNGRHGAALHGLNKLGPEGYHWRVCVEDKPTPGADSNGMKTLSWWDIQDENATLPVKQATQSEFRRLLNSPLSGGDTHISSDAYDSAAKAAKGAFKTFGKVVSNAVSGHESGGDTNSGPLVSVISFKLLDVVKMHDDFVKKHAHSSRGSGVVPMPQPRPPPVPRAPTSRPTPPAKQPPPQPRSVTPNHYQQPQRSVTAPARPPASEPSLMDFGAPTTAGGGAGRAFHHSSSMNSAAPRNETKQQKLQREYREKASKAPRVWDDVDQRWVEVDPKVANSAAATVGGGTGGAAAARSMSGGDLMGGSTPRKVKGLSMEESQAAAARKSATVQQAVHSRVAEMKQSQAKAVAEVRQRESAKKAAENEEDVVRRKLEPKIKAWSEEHGKKKQLRALLGSLQMILWPGANWKPVGLGDLLDDKVCIKVYRKATLVVHPDKTHHMNPEQRFLAKRIFDALTQAKAEYDNGAK
jgi:hypothetical protein